MKALFNERFCDELSGYVYRGRLSESLTKLTGQVHAVKPNWKGWDLAWAEYLKALDAGPSK